MKMNSALAGLAAGLSMLALANVSRTQAAMVSTNILTFSESLNDKIVCTKDEGDLYCDMFTGDGFTISAKALLANIDITQFDTNTSFELMLGDYCDIAYTLGDDPGYVTGKTSATFVETYTDDNNKERVYQTTRLKWTASQLTVTVKAKTSDIDTSGLQPIIAYDYEGGDSGPISTNMEATMDFGDDLSVAFDTVTVTGKATTKDKTAKDGSDFSLSTVKIKGSGLGEAVSEEE